VLVADDSALMRSLLGEVIGASVDFEVAGFAATGYEAIRLVHELKPDLLTLDLAMPDLGGLEALHYIMSQAPLPVVIVSSQTSALADPALRALMDYGAIDFVPKPLGSAPTDMTAFRQRLIQALYLALTARVQSVLHLQRLQTARTDTKTPSRPAHFAIAIAASTGGPRALSEVIPLLPAGLRAAVLIVQHMPPHFTRFLARRLDSLGEVAVCEVEEGSEIDEGVVYVAAGGRHLDLERREAGVFARLTDGAALWGVKPSADVMFHAVARTFGPSSVAVVLTGMGRDGADGMRAIAAVGGGAIVQSEATCVIAGMPRAAAPYADTTLPLGDIAAELAARVKSQTPERAR
jgi:two-component system chemotaxis response regulator CheB